MEQSSPKFMPTSCRFSAKQMEYIDSMRKPGESRSSFISRVIQERIEGAENVDKIVTSVISKVGNNEFIEPIKNTLKSSFIDIGSSLTGMMKNILENSKTLSFQIQDMRKTMDLMKSEITDIKTEIKSFEVS